MKVPMRFLHWNLQSFAGVAHSSTSGQKIAHPRNFIACKMKSIDIEKCFQISNEILFQDGAFEALKNRQLPTQWRPSGARVYPYGQVHRKEPGALWHRKAH